MAVEKWKLGSAFTLAPGANLQALANNGYTFVGGGSLFDNTQGGANGDGYTEALIQGHFEFGSAPADGSAILLWFVLSIDGGGTFEDGASGQPARQPDVVFPLSNAGGTSQTVTRWVRLPPSFLVAGVCNDGTGQAIANNTNSNIKLLPATPEGV